jgi:hypothetical protein
MHFSRLSFIVARVITSFVVLLLAQVGFAGDGSFQHVAVDAPGTTHQLWLLSTRSASSCPRLDQTGRLRYWRCDADYQWRNSSLSEVLGSDDPETTTLIYVHENRVSEAESFDRARVVFRQLSKVAPAEKRFRLIAVSWPSDRIGHRGRPDVQIKAQRSEAHGFYLAWLLDQIDPDVPVSLFGDSFGPRMITASLHCLAGGSIQGQRLSERADPPRRPVRAVLMSAALDAHWLSAGQRHGLALTQVERMLVTVNPADEALRFYPRMYRLVPKGADALGYVGLRCGHLMNQHAGKIVEWNVSSIVGRTHSWRVYEGSSLVMQQIAPYLFGE